MSENMLTLEVTYLHFAGALGRHPVASAVVHAVGPRGRGHG